MNNSKYSMSRLKSYLYGFLPSFFSYFMKRDKKLIVLNSFHNIQFSDNTKYLFIYLINNEKSKTVRYVINDDNLRDKLIQQYGNYFIETKTFKGKIYALKASLWFVNAFELPVQGLFLNKRRKVIHMTHGVTSKNAGLYEKDVSIIKQLYYAFIRTSISYTMTPYKGFQKIVGGHLGVKENKVLICGFPRFDPLINKEFCKIKKRSDEVSILYAPTWRHYSDIKLFPFVDFDIIKLNKYCKDKNIKIYLRVHPRFEDSIPPELLSHDFIKIFSGKDYPDINDYFENFDMLITDYSSIFYDYMILDRPIFFFMYDYDLYKTNIGLVDNFLKYAIGYKSTTQKDFIQNLDDALTIDSYKTQREDVRKRILGNSKNNSCDLINLLKNMKIFDD